MYTLSQIKSVFKTKNYLFFNSGKDYDLNIFSVRNSDLTPDSFNDDIYCVYQVNSEWIVKSWKCTTDPGLSVLLKPSNPKGVAILKPGQYRTSHQIGLHQGKYEALVQRKPVSVYRDNNKDKKFDFNESTVDTGIFGINIHHAGVDSSIVSNWSEGCTVFKRLEDFNEFMKIANSAKAIHGNGFTYTLFNQVDFV